MLPAVGIAGGLLLIAFTLTLRAASPAAGDLMLLVAGANASNTTGSVVEINAATAGQSAIQTIALPDTTNATDSFRMSGSATSTGYVARSNDGVLLSLTGHNSTNTSSNANTLNPRAVYTIDASGTVVKQTTYTGSSGNQTRGATTLNGTTWFIADQGGLYTNNSTSASPSGNFRAAKSFGGTVFIGQTSSTSTVIQVAAVSAASGGTVTGLPGLTNNASFMDFYLVQSGANGTAYDVLYILSDTSATAGTIAKYSLVSGSWTANGSYTTTFGGFGLAAAASGPGAALYVSTGTGATSANSVIKLTDTAGYNAAIGVTTANNVTLYTTGAGTIIKGLDFAPQSGAASGPRISQNPQSQTIASGQTATLTVVASGTAPLSYQWYQGPAGVTTTPVGTNSSSFTTPYTDNQASPLSLFQYAPNGTASATYISSLVLPQTGSGANLAVSGEYGSSSEGTLHLSGSGQYLSIAGYGINAAAFNANPALYGADPAKPAALAQSGSLTGAGYTPIPRVVALIDPYGNVNSSTALYNVFNTNNPRSVYTDDGMKLYISGQGTGNDLTGGVFYATLGSSSATAITGATANSNSPPPATIAQDAQDVQIFGGQLYAAIDSKEGTGSNRDYIGTLGSAGAPPTATVGAPVRLSGFGNNGGTGKLTITAATTNGINSSGQEINLSPVSYFFANPTTLYVADSGQPKNDSVLNDSNGVALGNGGLQKWVLNSGTWTLQYTLGVQNGLPLVSNTSLAGATGLYGLTGKVVGGDVLLYVTNYSKNDLDPTFLYGFTDVLAATTNPGTSFRQLAAAPADSNFKGVAFAPAAPSGSVTITSSPSGMAFTSAGAGCAPATTPRR